MKNQEYEELRELINKKLYPEGVPLKEGVEVEWNENHLSEYTKPVKMVKCMFGGFHRRDDGELIWLKDIYNKNGYETNPIIEYKFYSQQTKDFSGYGYISDFTISKPVSISDVLRCIDRYYYEDDEISINISFGGDVDSSISDRMTIKISNGFFRKPLFEIVIDLSFPLSKQKEVCGELVRLIKEN